MSGRHGPYGVYLTPVNRSGREHLLALYGSPRAHLIARFMTEREAVGYARLLQHGNANTTVAYVYRMVRSPVHGDKTVDKGASDAGSRPLLLAFGAKANDRANGLRNQSGGKQ